MRLSRRKGTLPLKSPREGWMPCRGLRFDFFRGKSREGPREGGLARLGAVARRDLVGFLEKRSWR